MKSHGDFPEQRPFYKYPALTLRRLGLLRAIAWEVQVRVAAQMDWGHGENRWIAGSKGYTQRVDAYSLAAKAEYADWLTVKFIERRFMLDVRGILVRIFGAPEDADVPTRYTDPTKTKGEILLLNQALTLFELPPSDLVLRLEVIHDQKARPLEVIIAQVDAEGERHDPFVIPAPMQVILNADSEEAIAPTIPTTKPRKRSIKLDVPPLTSRKELEDKSKNSSAEGPHA